MEIKNLLKNKFVLSVPIALVLLGCLYKFNEFKSLSENTEPENEGENKEKENKFNMVYYMKAFLVCYAIGLCLLILIKKGFSYLKNQKNKGEVPVENNKDATITSKFKNMLGLSGGNNSKTENVFTPETAKVSIPEPTHEPIPQPPQPTQPQPQSQQPQQSLPALPATSQSSEAVSNPSNGVSLLENMNISEAKQLNLDVDTSTLEEIPLSTVKPPSSSLEDKKNQLIAKRKKLMELKKRRQAQKKNKLAIEAFNTGNPNF